MARLRRFRSRSSSSFWSNSPAASAEVPVPSADIPRILTLVPPIVLEMSSLRLIQSLTDIEQATISTCPPLGGHPGRVRPARLLGSVDLGEHRQAQGRLRPGQ